LRTAPGEEAKQIIVKPVGGAHLVDFIAVVSGSKFQAGFFHEAANCGLGKEIKVARNIFSK
jgi:hypothetical protein